MTIFGAATYLGCRAARAIIGPQRCPLAAECASTPEMMERVYGELRRLAGMYLRRQRRDHTLQPTALVHEAYLRMAVWEGAPWRDRAHFVGVAALVMRQVLVMHARKHGASQRRSGNLQVSMSEAAPDT